MNVTFRQAVEDDLSEAVALMHDDVLGSRRESGDIEVYRTAFQKMQAEPFNQLIVGEADGGRIVAVYQFTLITGISQIGLRRAQVEAVRVAADVRSQGIGKAAMEDAEDRARNAGARLMQLTSNKERDRTHEFYRRLGYVDTHLGFKKPL